MSIIMQAKQRPKQEVMEHIKLIISSTLMPSHQIISMIDNLNLKLRTTTAHKATCRLVDSISNRDSLNSNNTRLKGICKLRWLDSMQVKQQLMRALKRT